MHELTENPILAAGYEYWQSLPMEAGIPDRRNVDSVQLPKQILSNVALLKIVNYGADAIFSLVGREFDENFGVSLKGKTTVELTEGHYRDYMLNHFRILMDTREVVYSESSFRWDSGGHWRTRRLLMPLSDGEPGVVAMVFKMQIWPREAMRGLPFCEVAANSSNVNNSKPYSVISKERIEAGLRASPTDSKTPPQARVSFRS